MWAINYCRFFWCGIGLIITVSSVAQSVIDSDAYFEQGLQELQVPQADQALEPVKFNGLDDLELRTQNDGLAKKDLRFTLRVSPLSARQVAAQKKLFGLYNTMPTESSNLYVETVVNLYLDWIDLHFINREQAVLQQLNDVWQDKTAINNKLLGSYEVDFKELVDLEVSQNRLKQIAYELSVKKQNILETHELDTHLVDGELISLESIQSYLQNVEQSNQLTPQLLMANEKRVADYEKELVLSELELERAEAAKVLDFAQLRYTPDDQDLFGNRLAMSIGVRLPSSNSRKLKMAKLKTELLDIDTDLELDAQEKQTEVLAEIKALRTSLKIALHYKELMEQEKVELERISGMMTKQEGFSPKLFLDIKEILLSNQLKLQSYEQDVYTDYVSLLNVMGRLTSAPFVNYLKA